MKTYDAAIIGGGFYGCVIANYLCESIGLKDIVLIEKNSDLLQRASRNNQARVHNGYHYPRSYKTAFSSHKNLPRFIKQWQLATSAQSNSLYAIAKQQSLVTAQQFERFCLDVSLPVNRLNLKQQSLFNPHRVDAIYEVYEPIFNAVVLAKLLVKQLHANRISICANTKINAVYQENENCYQLYGKNNNKPDRFRAKKVFNCTYANLNQIAGDWSRLQSVLKHEFTEMALIKLPETLHRYAITVMDGPFFSCLPYPSVDGYHTLSHVRYTPHFSWQDKIHCSPDDQFTQYEAQSRAQFMIRDAARYLPAIANAQYLRSLYEIKTVLAKNESDDGRPILFEKHQELPNCFSILGGKLDNIFDILEKIDTEVYAQETA